MPRLRIPEDPFYKYRGLVTSRKAFLAMSNTELAERMGVSSKTISKYQINPGLMSLDQIRQLNRILAIRAEDAREALPMW